MDTLSLYANYLKERENKELYADPEGRGFATYEISKESCYIVDIYVLPEFRKQNVASEMADVISQEAKDKGCEFLHGSVSPRDSRVTENMKVLLAYGMSFSHYNSDLIFFAKKLNPLKQGDI